MPDLEQNAVTAWLTVLRPDPTAPAWPPPIRAIETQEDVPDRLAVLGATFDAAAQRDPQAVAAALRNAPLRDEMAALLAQLGAARVLRLLHWLSETNLPDCHAVISGLLQGDSRSGVALRATVAAVTRPAILRRIFAPDRIAALERACGESFREGVL
jgi:hypothetical protein